MKIFHEEGVGYAETCTLEEALNHPHTAVRNMVVTVDNPETGPMKMLGNPIKVDGLDEHFSSPPLYGEHTEQILRELLDYSEAQISTLKTEGVIHSP
jgi:succinate--hydroxymethylglutarate CoA-transferase